MSGYEDIEIFPADQNLWGNSILSTPPYSFKDLNSDGFSVLLRDMWDNILYSKGGSETNSLWYNWNWDNSKSVNTYRHAYTEHGSHIKRQSLIDRAKYKGFQIGQWVNQDEAAKFISEIAKQGPGVYDVKLPNNVLGRSFLDNGTELTTDMARIVVGGKGNITTAFPYNSNYKISK